MPTEQPPTDQLVTGLAHRMNDILTLFHGYVGMMLENDKLDPGTRASLAKIKDGAAAATELMDRTHALVRPCRIVARELELSFFLEMLRATFQAMCGPQTWIEISVPEDMPLLRTDMSRVKSALVELVCNACDATAESGGTIRIVVGYEPPPANEHRGEMHDATQWVAITVINEGPAIPSHVAERMFEPFYTTRKRQQAAGLGLNVVADAVQRIGGMLTHRSEPGETRFSILLPLHSELESTPAREVASPRAKK